MLPKYVPRSKPDAAKGTHGRLNPGPSRLRLARPLAGLLLVLCCALLPGAVSAEDPDAAQEPILVSNNSFLVPEGVGPNTEFRLLFVTIGTSDATSRDIAVYNTFVQNQASFVGVAQPALFPHASKFRVVGSTQQVDARDNTNTTYSEDSIPVALGVPIYWLNGDKVADEYADFYDGTWDSEAARNQTGALAGNNHGSQIRVWTGSTTMGAERPGAPLGGTSGATGNQLRGAYGVLDGHLASATDKPLSAPNTISTSEKLPFYALSPVFKTMPSIEVVIPDGQSSTVEETDSSANTNGLTYQLVLNPAPTQAVDVTVAISDDDTADYLASSVEGSPTISVPTASSQTDIRRYARSFLIQPDPYTAVDGTVTVEVTGAPAGYEVLGGPAEYTVEDDDASNHPLVSVSVVPTEITEGSKSVTYTFTLDRVTTKPFNLKFEIEDEGGNFLNRIRGARTTRMSANSTRTRYIVGTRSDTTNDNDGAIRLTLLPGEYYRVDPAKRVAETEVKNDSRITRYEMQAADITLTEGGDAVFTFELNEVPHDGSGLRVRTSSLTAGRDDYHPVSTRAFSWPNGEKTATYTVRTKHDDIHDPDEQFELVLSNAIGFGFKGGAASLRVRATILDEADLPAISLSSPSAREGQKLKFKATLSNPSDLVVTARYEDTGDGTAKSGSRYTALPAGTVTFAAGETEQTIVVDVPRDGIDQTLDETVILRLTQPVNASFAGEGRSVEGTGTILHGAAPSLAVRLRDDALPVHEGDTAVFTVELLVDGVVAPWDQDIRVWWVGAWQPGTAGSSDYRYGASPVTIPAGETRALIEVHTIADTRDEGPETVGIVIAQAQTVTGTPRGVDHDVLGNQVYVTIYDGAAIVIRDAPEVGEGQTMTFTVDLGAPAADDVVLSWSTEDGTATAGSDYTAVTSGQVTIPAGERSATISVATLQDTTDERRQTLDVVLTRTSGTAAEARMRATGTIRDDDPRPTVRVVNAFVTEGREMSFQIRLSAASEKAVRGEWRTQDGTAVAGLDYEAASGAFIIGPGKLRARIVQVVTIDDKLAEGGEFFRILLFNVAEANRGTGGAGTILDDDGDLTLSVSDAEVEEGAGAVLTFTVRLSVPATSPVSVDWKAPPNSHLLDQCGTFKNPCLVAKTGGSGEYDDYKPVAATTLTFARGEQEKQITVQVKDDIAGERDETLDVILENARGAKIADGTGVGTIQDDDLIYYWIANESKEIDEGERLVVTVRRNQAPHGSSSATARICLLPSSGAAGSATPSFTSTTDDDVHVSGRHSAWNGCAVHQEVSGTLQWVTFGPTDLEATFTIYTIQDNRMEGDETFTVTSSGAVPNQSLDQRLFEEEFTIIDDDSRRLRVERVEGTLWEGEQVTYKLYVDPPLGAGESATVTYKTTDGTAIGGKDFTAVADQTLTLGPPSSPGAALHTIVVSTTEDRAFEGDETFTLVFHSPSADLQLPTGGGDKLVETILDDDRGTISLTDTVVGEGAEATIKAALSSPIDRDATVTWETVDDAAKSASDYSAVTSGSLTIAAGMTSAVILVQTTEDTVDEPDEAFQVRITSITPADFRIGSAAMVTIVDNDAPTLDIGGIANATVEENVVWTLTPAVGGMPIGDLTWTIEGGNDEDLFGIDAATGLPTLPAQDFEAPADHDTDNLYEVTLRATDEDGTTDAVDVTLTVSDVTYGVFRPSTNTRFRERDPDEGGVPKWNWEYHPSAAYPSYEHGKLNWRVDYEELYEGDVPAENADFEGSISGTLQATSESPVVQVQVQIAQDDLDEPEEAYRVLFFDLTGDVGYQANESSTTRDHFDVFHYIDDDDDTPRFSGESLTVPEGDALSFTVTRNGATENEVSVKWHTALPTSEDEIPASTADFTHTPAPELLEFASGETSKTITIQTTEDTLYEQDEKFYVVLSDPAKAEGDPGGDPSVEQSSYSITIEDDDDEAAPTVTVDAPSVTEGDSGTTALTFTVTLSTESGAAATVQYQDLGLGSAESGTDYVALPAGTLTFAPGTTEQTVTVTVNGDQAVELDESIVLGLSSPVNALFPDGNARLTTGGTIANDDYELSIDDVSVAEGELATFTISLDPAHGSDVMVTATTSDGTAKAPSDYTSNAQTLTIPAGQTSATFAVQTVTDGAVEGDESFKVTLSSATSAVRIVDAQGVATISDVDSPISVRIFGDSSVAENGDAKTFTVVAQLRSGAAVVDSDVTITVGAPSDAATSNVDYQAVAPFTLTIPTGSSSALTTFTLKPIDDFIDEGDSERVSVTASFGDGQASTSVHITDDDTRGIRFTPKRFTIAERDDPDTDRKENQARFAVTLLSQPTGSFQLNVGWDRWGGAAYMSLSPTRLTFTPSNWDTPQWVTVTAEDPAKVKHDFDRIFVIKPSVLRSRTDYDPLSQLYYHRDAWVRVDVTDQDLAPPGLELTVDADTATSGVQSELDEDGGAKQVRVTATFTGGAVFSTSQYVDITVGQASDSAQRGVDYTSTNPARIFIHSFEASGSTTFTLTPMDDTRDEKDETISVLGELAGYTVSPAEITINDDDNAPTSISLSASPA
ncbi:MAG: hypothetical protein F4X89_04570, partial [Dehalococcoidia bacterium]|nr:hypothetical protein [Dehalococcoidia bacterium]